MALTFPMLDPVLLQIGPLSIRWYSLAYIAGLLLGLFYIKYLFKRFSPSDFTVCKQWFEDLFTYVALGVILGGRLGYVLFYNPDYYFSNPLSILKVWEGGMAFHGGFVGVICAIFLFAKRYHVSPIVIGDYIAPTVSIGLFFGRIANFINAELYGRVTDVAWAVRFPDPYFQGQFLEPRHPSQIYEALTEGALLFIVLWVLIHCKSILRSKGQATGVFMIGYGVSRVFCEFFREPDDFLGFILKVGNVGLTQGMILSLPMIILGGYFFWKSLSNNVTH